MAIFIPDLFGSYVDGREKAIDSNWKDMQNYNGVLGGQLGNAKTMATFDSDVLNHKGQGLSSFAHGKTDYDKSKLDTLLLKYMLNGATANGGAWMAQYAANKLNGLNANAAASPLLTQNAVSKDNDSTWMSSQYAQQFFLPYLQNQLELMKAQQQYYKNGGYYGYGYGTGTGVNGDGTVSGTLNKDNVSAAIGGIPDFSGQGEPKTDPDQDNTIGLKNTDIGKSFLNGGF